LFYQLVVITIIIIIIISEAGVGKKSTMNRCLLAALVLAGMATNLNLVHSAGALGLGLLPSPRRL